MSVNSSSISGHRERGRDRREREAKREERGRRREGERERRSQREIEPERLLYTESNQVRPSVAEMAGHRGVEGKSLIEKGRDKWSNDISTLISLPVKHTKHQCK